MDKVINPRIEIKVCSGTLCYLMGSSELFEMGQKLSEMFDREIELKPEACLGYCNSQEPSKPPCVEIDGQLVREASIENIINELKKL